ncbi:MAG: hypothetical protein AAFS10_21605 [Myxococcota bacterium]
MSRLKWCPEGAVFRSPPSYTPRIFDLTAVGRRLWAVPLTLALLCMLVLHGCCFTELELEEAAYRNNIEELDEAIVVTSKKTQTSLKRAKKRYQKRYKELPEAEGERVAALKTMNKGMDEELAGFADDISKAHHAQANKEEAERVRWMEKHAGDWRDNPNIDGRYTMRVHIWNGRLEYRRVGKDGTSQNVTAPITKTSPTSFSAGALGVETTLMIDTPPQKHDGVWTMTIDGKELVRVDL